MSRHAARTAAALAEHALELADDPRVLDAIREVAQLVRAYLARRHAPHVWAVYHRQRAAEVGRWRARRHRRLAAKFAALAAQLDSEAADRCGLVSPVTGRVPGARS